MKMKKLPILLLLSLGMFIAPVATSFVSGSNNTYIAAHADSDAVNAFLTRFNEIREEQHNSGKGICDTTKEQYNELIALYSALSQDEKEEVNAIKDTYDPDYTIGEEMKEIVRLYFSPQSISEAPKPKLDQKTTIIIASVVSIVGMSAISVLFILRNNKFIE